MNKLSHIALAAHDNAPTKRAGRPRRITRVFPAPKNHRQRRRFREQAQQRHNYLLRQQTVAMRVMYGRERDRLAKGDYFPEHHLETHVPNQGCLFCLMEIAEIVDALMFGERRMD